MNLNLTKEEEAHVRTAIRFLRVRFGNWESVTKVLHLGKTSIPEIMANKRAVSERLAFRVARLSGVPIDDVLTGRFPAEGTCPYCGHVPEERP